MRCWILSIWPDPVGSWQEVTVTFRLLFWSMCYSLALEIKICALAYDVRWRLICERETDLHKENRPMLAFQRKQFHPKQEIWQYLSNGETYGSCWGNMCKIKPFSALLNIITITRNENRDICVLVCRKLLEFPQNTFNMINIWITRKLYVNCAILLETSWVTFYTAVNTHPYPGLRNKAIDGVGKRVGESMNS